MHPLFHETFVNDRVRELERATARAHVERSYQPAIADEPVGLRLCRASDDDALGRLAVLEGRPLPAGPFVVAEVDGSLIAALPLDGGAPLADPFRSTIQLIPLLRLRAEQLSSAERTHEHRNRLSGVFGRGSRRGRPGWQP